MSTDTRLRPSLPASNEPKFDLADPQAARGEALIEAEAGLWPRHRTPVLDWLMTQTFGERFIDNILAELCERLVATGMPLSRVSVSFRIHHPQWLGARLLWRPGMVGAEVETFDHAMFEREQYLNSPIQQIHADGKPIRHRLEKPDPAAPVYPVYDELIAQGMTDYAAWPLENTLGRRHVVSFATDRPGGFGESDLAGLADIIPAFSLVSEIRLKNRFARTLLDTYVGPHASAEILAGAITRGSGSTVQAAILICDLRDFTTLSELWPRDDVIDLLNGYFDAMSEPIERHGGEILKFVGDGLLAIFPLKRETALTDLLKAVEEGKTAMAALNADHARRGHPHLGYGVGVHVGDVMYGNIGSRRRLDFTVIGPAVNIASRLETLTKTVKRPVLLSKAFVTMAGLENEMEALGAYPLRGLGEPMEVYALPAATPMPEPTIAAQ